MLTQAYKFAVAVILIAVCFVPDVCNAQDIPTIGEKQKSVILFDIRIEKMLAEAAAIGINTNDFVQTELPPPFNTINLTDVSRVFGSTSLPENLDAAIGMQRPGADLPFEFFVRVQFKDADALERFEDEFKRNSDTTKIGNKEFYSAGQNAPSNVVAHRVDETSFEVGTTAYCRQAKRTFFTDRLNAAYKSAPNHPVRIAMDLQTPSAFLAELVAMGKQQLDNPVSSAYLDLIDNANSLAVTQSLGSENLLTLIAEGKNESDAEELAGGIDSLLGTAKLAIGPMMMQLERGAPELKESFAIFPEMVKSMATQTEGKTVQLVVAKPEGFDESIGEIQTVMMAKAKENQRLNNLRLLALSVHNYEAAYRNFPFTRVERRNEEMSWRVSVLPFLEEMKMADEMDLEASPSQEPNSAFADKMPVFYGSDGRLSNVLWIQSKVDGFAHVTDGTSNTIMLIENPDGRPWMENNPLTIDEAIKLVQSLPEGKKLGVAFYDGSVRYIHNKIDEADLKSLFTPDDGQVIKNMDW